MPRKRTQDNAFSIHSHGRLDGSAPGKGRLCTTSLSCNIDLPLSEWLKDRAAILGVPYTVLVRDVLALWRELVTAGERERGIDLSDVEEPEYVSVHVPARAAGYRDSLLPTGRVPSHLDSTPLGPEEMNG